MAADAISPYIEFKDVSKAFGDRVVLKDVSFEVLPGEMVCILGRSGVGKSVALHNIMGFLKPDSGRVIVACQDGTDYDEKQMEEIRKKVTMVFQNGALFDSLTVGENVEGAILEHHGDFLTDFFHLFLVVVGNVLTGDDAPAGIRLKEPHDVVERHRFSDAAAAKNADHLTRQHLEADILKNDPVAKCLGDVLKLDVGRDCVRSHGLSAWHEMPARLKRKRRDSRPRPSSATKPHKRFYSRGA